MSAHHVDGATPTSLATHAFPAASRCRALLLLSLSVVEESGQNWGHVAALFQEAGVPTWRRSDGLQELGSNFTGGPHMPSADAMDAPPQRE